MPQHNYFLLLLLFFFLKFEKIRIKKNIYKNILCFIFENLLYYDEDYDNNSSINHYHHHHKFIFSTMNNILCINLEINFIFIMSSY